MRPRVKKLIMFAPLAVLGMLAFAALGGALVMWLWNWLLPPLLHWPQIGFWQGLGLLALCRILFGGLGWRGGSRRFTSNMSPEEREAFRQRIRERCGWARPTGGESTAPSS